MKKDLLIRLITKIKGNLNFQIELVSILRAYGVHSLEFLLDLTDDEVKDILSSENDQLITSKILFYNQKDNFGEELRNIISNALRENNRNVYYGIKAIPHISDDKVVDMLNLIINVKEEYQACEASKAIEIGDLEDLSFVKIISEMDGELKAAVARRAVCHKPFIAKECCKEILDLISKTDKDFKILNMDTLITDHDILLQSSDFVLGIVKRIFSIDDEELSECITDTVTDIDVLNSGKAIEVVDILSKLDSYHLEKTMSVAIEPIVTRHEKYLEIIKTIGQITAPYQLMVTENLLTRGNVFEHEDAFEIIKLVATSNTTLKAEKLAKLANDINVLKLKDSLEVLKLIYNAKENYQVDNATVVAQNLHYPSFKERALELVKSVIMAESQEKAEAIKDKFLLDLEKYNGNKDKKVPILEEKEVTVRELMKQFEYDSLINGLNDSKEEDINPRTKVKVKVNKN